MALAVLAAIAAVTIVVVPVVSPTSFEPTKTCRTAIFCESVWVGSNGLNWGMVVLFVSATVMIVAGVGAAISATQNRPVTAWIGYAHDVALQIAEALGIPGVEQLDVNGYRSRAQRLLATMAAVARSLSDAEAAVTVDASLMIALYPPPATMDGVRFLHRNRALATYIGVLIVDAYSSSSPLPYLRLPIDKEQHVLPGAPAACERGPVCIDDTLHIDWSDHKGVDEELRATVEKYFQEQRSTLRTMICIPIKKGDRVLGVVNIHSPKAHLFQTSADLINRVLEPYLALMLALLDHRHTKSYAFVQAA